MSDAQAFESALRDNPDDLAGWCAYADYLAERGDPRGTFMQVQLALEEESRSKEEREALKEQEAELLEEHERKWLGELAPHLLDSVDSSGRARPAVEHWWGRGFIAEMKVSDLTMPLAETMATAHAARFLQKLHIQGSRHTSPTPELTPTTLFPATRVPTPPGAPWHEAYFELIGSPCLECLRVFQVGADDEPTADGWTEECMEAPGVEHVVASTPRIEELYLLCNRYDPTALFALPNLTRLQVLRVYGLGHHHREDYEIPLTALARNPALGALTHLLVHPRFTPSDLSLPLSQVRELVNSQHLTSLSHLQLRLSNMGDEGVRAIIESGILKRLGWLDLRNGAITDTGARLFAEYAPTRNLRRLDLSRNRVTRVGLNQLRRAGVNAIVDNSLSRRESERAERAEREADME
jgi:uncharacterized protein (TIGR02996 family)